MKQIVAGSLEAAIVDIMRTRDTPIDRHTLERFVLQYPHQPAEPWTLLEIESALGTLRTDSHGMLAVVRTCGPKQDKYELTEAGK